MKWILWALLLSIARLEVSTETKQNLLLFISITSGPHHLHLRQSVRNTWLTPCMASSLCDYRFFVDVPDAFMTPELTQESVTHKDLVFRDWCPLMKMHPNTVNYGNCNPDPVNLSYNLTINGTWQMIDNPRYFQRRYYKIDWKMCFLKWIHEHNKDPHYHVFVEDDSFMCIENLLHQSRLLHEKKTNGTHYLPFRTGAFSVKYPGGFDDSSTFMSEEVANIFLQYYRTEKLKCKGSFLASFSWGISWHPKACNWQEELKNSPDIHTYVNMPQMDCTANKTIVKDISKCPDFPLIFHNKIATDMLFAKYKTSNSLIPLCENMLLLDKVKDVTIMEQLWRGATSKKFKDFSSVFMNDGSLGWNEALNNL